MQRQIVVIGAGHAGVQLCDSLRAAQVPAAITLVNDEPEWPYQKPPLSKELLKSGVLETLPLRAPQFYDEREINLIRGQAATRIDRQARTVSLADGRALAYDDLILALGASNRKVSVPGAQLDGVLDLRTAADARGVCARLEQVSKAVVIGAGFIGLEFASAASAKGIEVTVLDIADRPMSRVLSPGMSRRFETMHRHKGVRFLFGEGVGEIFGTNGAVRGVRTDQGRELEADMVLVSVGAQPNVALAQAAGLEVDNGIVVDGRLQTSDPNIWAIGDCVSFPSVHVGTRVRLESVQNATDQARHLAEVLTGSVELYRELPWFWTIQGDYKLQIAGIYRPGDLEVQSGTNEDKCSVLCFREGTMVAVESLNTPGDHVAARKFMGAARLLDYEAARLDGFNLKDYVKAHPAL